MKAKTDIKEKNKLNFFGSALLVIGLFFLFNPMVGLIDLLPDFIGYFLIIIALDQVKRLNGDIEHGVKQLKYLCGVSAVFFLLMFNTFKMDSSWNLTLTFSYMAITVILGVSACSGIFNGIDYLTDRHGSENVPSAYEPAFMTKVYIIAKAILVVIPELFALVEVDAATDISGAKDYNAILNLEKYVVVFCIIVSFALAVAWLKYVLKYRKALVKDTVLNSKLQEMYIADYSVNGVPFRFFSLYMGNALLLVSHIFVYDFVVDTIHFLPEFLSVLFSAFGLILIRKYINPKGLFGVGIAAFAFQVATFIYKVFFVENILLELWDVTIFHLIVGSVIALGYIVFTFLYFYRVHKVTEKTYEKIFGWKLLQNYRFGELFFFVSLAAGGANIICPIWRPSFSGIMILSLVVSMYHFSKLYTKFDINK